MPTENRSSTEMVSVPNLLAADNDRDMLEYLGEGYASQVYVCDQCGHEEPLETFDLASDLRHYLAAYPVAPPEQNQGEPVGTLLIDEYFDGREVGDVDVQLDTKACEQLAEKYPGQSLPLYICPAPAFAGEVERLRSIERSYGLREALLEQVKGERDRMIARTLELADQLAEQDALLRGKSGDLIRMAAHLISAPLFALQDLQDEDKKMTRARVDHAVDVADARLKDAAYELRRIADALSASAGPIQLDHEIPGTSFERLNMLANQGE